MLDILAAKGAEATFFVLGVQAARYPDLIRRIAREGHALAGHTWRHVRLTGMGEAAFRKEVDETNSLFASLTGQKVRCVLVAADGGLLSFGDAPFLGSGADLPLRAPIIAMAATPSGTGYWLLGQDGAVFAFGDGPFLGRASVPAGQRAVGVMSSPSGPGCWLITERPAL